MDQTIQNLKKIKHIVVMMFENRSFDHMLGFLYKDSNNISPLGHPFEGLTGNETNLDSKGNPVKVFPIPKDNHPYFWPGTDPGEGYYNTNSQLYGNYKTPAPGTVASNQGFVTDFEYTLNWQRAANKKKANSWHIIEGTIGNDIMGMYTPDLLPVLSGLAKGYAVCDHWYCSVPTETLPNRAFLHMATSQGRLNDRDKIYSANTIFNLLADNNNTWAIYGYDTPVLTRQSLQAIPPSHPNGTFGNFADFKAAAADNKLADYIFLAPKWGPDGNSQHPNYDVAKGEQLLLEIYNTLYDSPAWKDTLLIVTYDEHGGCYDHVPPPENAAQPADSPELYGFKFDRFGVRVPTVLISPWIEAGTVFRVNKPDTDLNGSQKNAPIPFDHTSVLSTIEKRFGLPNLSARDAAAPHVGGVLTLSSPRTDNPIKGVVAPVSGGLPPAGEERAKYKNKMSHLQEASLDMMTRMPDEKRRKPYYHDHWPHIRNSEQWEIYVYWHYNRYYD